MPRIKTFTIGGSLLPADLNSIQDDYELAFSTYRPLPNFRKNGSGNNGYAGSSGTYLLAPFFHTPGVSGGPWYGTDDAVWFNPDDFVVGNRAFKLRHRAQLITNAVAPGGTYTVGWHLVTAWNVDSAVGSPIVAGVSSAITGSTIAFSSPGASTRNQNVTADFNPPIEGGFYAACVVLSAAPAAGAYIVINSELQMRWV